jgi:broad specificity phosphatase PhoE
MRHFERPPTITYFTELNQVGKKNAIRKILEINNLNINIVFSSPFVRTLQSIEPFAKKNNVKVNVENSLYEFMESGQFTLDNYKQTHNDIKNKELIEIINNEYQSFFHINELEKPKTDEIDYEKNILKRTENFINHLHQMYQNTDVNVLLVAHKGTINALLKKKNLNDGYELGKITELSV